MLACVAQFDAVAVGSWAQAAAGFAQAIAIAYAAYRAGDALKNWRHQKVLEQRFEATGEVLALSRQLKAAFEALRAPHFPKFELALAEKEISSEDPLFLPSDPADREKTIQVQCLHRRMNKYNHIWSQLDDLSYTRSFIFGSSFSDALEQIRDARSEIECRLLNAFNMDETEEHLAIVLRPPRDKTSKADKLGEKIDRSLSVMEDSVRAAWKGI